MAWLTRSVGVRQLGHRLLDDCDVGSDPDDAAGGVVAFGNLNPFAVGKQALDRALIAVMPFHRLTDKLLDVVASLRVLAELCSFPDDVLKLHAGLDKGGAESIEIAEALIAGDQAILLVPHDEAVRHRLDGAIQQITRFLAFRLDSLALAQSRVQVTLQAQAQAHMPLRGL